MELVFNETEPPLNEEIVVTVINPTVLASIVCAVEVRLLRVITTISRVPTENLRLKVEGFGSFSTT